MEKQDVETITTFIKYIHQNLFKMRIFLLSVLLCLYSCKKKTSVVSVKTTCSFNNLTTDLQNGVITYYSFCGNTNDVSGNNNNGSLTNGAFTTDRFGNTNSALSLTSNSSVVCSSTSYNNPQNFTLGIWIKTTSLDYGRIIVFDETQCSHLNNWDRTIFINNGRAGFYVFPESIQNITGGPLISDNTWHHLAATMSSSGMKLYVDGELVASNPSITSAQAFNGYWRVGSFQNTTPIGSYDDFIIYSRALSDAEIMQLSQ